MNYEVRNIDCIDIEDDAFSLIYLDPPYSFEGEDSYYGVGDDFHTYLSYMHDRLKRLSDVLDENGNIVVHVDYKAVHNIKVMMDSIFGRDNFRNEIIWCYSNPATVETHLPRKHDNLLWYGRGEYIFNPERIPHKTKMNVGGDAAWSKDKIPWEHYRDKGKLLEDWWVDIPALCRNEKEKTGYATQKPLALMKRVVSLWSDKGQRVLDPFCGSGSFLEAASRLDRVSVGCDVNEEACEIAERRLDAVEEDLFADA